MNLFELALARYLGGSSGGGGSNGGGLYNPIVAIEAVNTTSNNIYATFIALNDNDNELLDNTASIQHESSEVLSVVALWSTYSAIYYATVSFLDSTYTRMEATPSNAVNCTYQNGWITVTDPSAPASITLTVAVSSGGGVDDQMT